MVYLALLNRAAWEPGPRVINGNVVHLEAGECVFGAEELGLELSLSRSQIRTAIIAITRTSVIATRITTVGTIAKLLGYGENGESTERQSPAVSPPESPATQPQNRQQPAQNIATINKGTEKREKNTKKTDKNEKGGRVPLPHDWVPFDADAIVAYAVRIGLDGHDILDQREAFIDDAIANGKVFADSPEARDAAFRRWLKRQSEWLTAKGEIGWEASDSQGGRS
jgi:hypothetical protein